MAGAYFASSVPLDTEPMFAFVAETLVDEAQAQSNEPLAEAVRAAAKVTAVPDVAERM